MVEMFNKSLYKKQCKIGPCNFPDWRVDDKLCVDDTLESKEELWIFKTAPAHVRPSTNNFLLPLLSLGVVHNLRLQIFHFFDHPPTPGLQSFTINHLFTVNVYIVFSVTS